MKNSLKKSKARTIKRWRDRKRRYDFVRRRIKKILSLSTKGWPRMTHNRDYLAWLDIVYLAKSRGLFSVNTSNCDAIANLKYKAWELSDRPTQRLNK